MTGQPTTGGARYCEHCDGRVEEWGAGREGEECCPRCGGTLYESKEAYIEEMVRWLGDRHDWSEDDVRQFLLDHGNPGKGQAAAIVQGDGRGGG